MFDRIRHENDDNFWTQLFIGVFLFPFLVWVAANLPPDLVLFLMNRG